jgi:GAF domain-containing protein
MKNIAPLDELSTAVGRILGLLLTQEKVDDAVHHLAEAVKGAMPGSVGAGVSLIDPQGHRTSTGFTDEVVKEADRLQYELGAGPCLTAWASEEPVLVDDVGTDARWPDWSRAVRGLPVRSVLSTPLVADGRAIGALKVYAEVPHLYNESAITLLNAFANPAATLLSHIQGTETVERMSGTLQDALQSRDLISQACGVLMERKGHTPEQALAELMMTARQLRTSLRDICAELVADTAAHPG